jgi:hypothetical protein
MLVRLKCDRASALHGLQYAEEVVDLPHAEAHALVRAGQAEFVHPEATIAAPAEAATKSRPAPRKR